MIRAIVAVIAGFGLWSVLWVSSNQIVIRLMPDAFGADGSIDSNGIMAGFVVLSFLYSLFAGYTVVTISRGSMKPAYVFAVIQLVVGIFVQSMYLHVLPAWYHISFLILLVPGVLIGARIRTGRAGPIGPTP
jgi:hypothetical protein